MGRKRFKRRKNTNIMILLLVITCFAFALIYMKYQENSVTINASKTTIDSSKINKGGYKFVDKTNEDLGIGNLILVTNDIFYKFPSDNNLVSVMEKKGEGYKVRDNNTLLNEEVMKPLNNLLYDFYKEKNVNDVMVLSAYRTLDDQTRIYNERVESLGKEEAGKWVATPKGSEHHTGYSFDFTRYTDAGVFLDFENKGVYKWIDQNAYRYGFIVRYPEEKSSLTGISFEPWHYRYVGKPHASVMVKEDMVLEEYIEYIKKFQFGKKHLKITDFDGINYEIYFVKASEGNTQVPVPKNDSYQISGNNIDGFIVTVKKKEG